MAQQKRMFSPQIVDSDAFLDMPASAQSLYFHLGMRADDDGFVGNPRKIMRMVGGNEDDLRLLQAKKFVLSFENGVIVIKHWRINNFIRKDRYKETIYIEEKNKLNVKDNNSYTLDNTQGKHISQVEWKSDQEKQAQNRCLTSGQPSVIPVVNPGKVRLGKVRIGKIREEENSVFDKLTFGEFKNVKLTEEEKNKLEGKLGDEQANKLIEELSGYLESTGIKKYRSHYATILNWSRRRTESKKGKGIEL